jgi:hypothetical protein
MKEFRGKAIYQPGTGIENIKTGSHWQSQA